ncbi:hypothetical protein EJ06DRAFT_528424 [Trichodelitschia bisporula]|uniref:Uncharacterized protein n=1 Tax=Trichodelitschia bisporula TaxID=703511 RepID=A0A6G1I2B4_9PEZI|nr:hypothetical protein EJ06DRAFT_528424 [Trichodelitschia bisporula]
MDEGKQRVGRSSSRLTKAARRPYLANPRRSWEVPVRGCKQRGRKAQGMRETHATKGTQAGPTQPNMAQERRPRVCACGWGVRSSE